jgi:hypothetical protein
MRGDIHCTSSNGLTCTGMGNNFPRASTNCKHASWPGEYGHLASTNSVTPVEQTLQSLVDTSLGLPFLVLMFNILCLLFIIIETMH